MNEYQKLQSRPKTTWKSLDLTFIHEMKLYGGCFCRKYYTFTGTMYFTINLPYPNLRNWPKTNNS